VDEQQAVFLETNRTLFRREAQTFDGTGQVVAEYGELEPGGIDREALAGHVATTESILDFVMNMFDRSGLLAMPVQKFIAGYIPVGYYRVMVAIRSIGEQDALWFEQAQAYIAQWTAVFCSYRSAGTNGMSAH